jgi:hypothetical protein
MQPISETLAPPSRILCEVIADITTLVGYNTFL